MKFVIHLYTSSFLFKSTDILKSKSDDISNFKLTTKKVLKDANQLFLRLFSITEVYNSLSDSVRFSVLTLIVKNYISKMLNGLKMFKYQSYLFHPKISNL